MSSNPLVFKHHNGTYYKIVGSFTHAETGRVHYALAREDNPESILVESHARLHQQITNGPTAPCKRYTQVKPQKLANWHKAK